MADKKKLSFSSKEKKGVTLEEMRHSCEHVLTMAMLRIWGNQVKAAMGPATDEGYYFDFDSSLKITEADFPRIEAEMAKIIAEDLPVVRDELSVAEAKKFFSHNIYKGNQYKHEWLDLIEQRGEKVSVYRMGPEGKDIPEAFVDICAGPHAASTGQIGAFKLLTMAGAYWHGDEKNKMLTRIYGTAFPTPKELDEYLWRIEEAKKRDHRKLGAELDLFLIDDTVGKGLPLWMPKGATVRRLLMDFALDTYLDRGYELVATPHIGSKTLWETSGHWNFYRASMYQPFGIDEEQYLLKPMNCPFHLTIYNARKHSYRELPFRWTEMGTVYRYEKTGELAGLTRVRGFTQDDAHIICRPEQLNEELLRMINLTKYIWGTLGLTDFEVSLSVRDPGTKDKYMGDEKHWIMAEKALEEALIHEKIAYKRYPGEAVFYGPKIDFLFKDSIGRKWQCSTIQIDFNLPDKFHMTYIDTDGTEKQPIMLHRALLGSIERSLGILIEHYEGAFPVWLAPVQAVLIPIADRHTEYCRAIVEKAKKLKLRFEIDERSERMNQKIRDAQMQKVPYMLVVGDKEIAENAVAVRLRTEENKGKVNADEFVKLVRQLADDRTLELWK